MRRAGEDTNGVDHGGALTFILHSVGCHLSRLTCYNACFFLCLQEAGILKCGREENNKEATVNSSGER